MKQASRLSKDRFAVGIATLGLAWGIVGTLAMTPTSSAYAADAQPVPATFLDHVQPLDAVEVTVIPPLDLKTVQREDEVAFNLGFAPRFAVGKPVHMTPDNSGTWERLDRQTQIWRLRVESPNAKNLNLGFTRYFMPRGARLFVFAPDFHDSIRPFNSGDNMPSGELWTPPVDGSKVVIEVTVPDAVKNQLVLELGAINVGYRPFAGKGEDDEEGGIASGACNIDVLCAQGTPWTAEIQSVGNLSIGGQFFCTGYLVNNTAQDKKPYLMTANHCGVTAGNAGALVAVWNYQNSTCRTPGSAESGNPGNGSTSTFSSGSVFRSTLVASDFCLVEFFSQPQAAWNLSWAGWDRTGGNSPNGAGIHHPNNQEKRISLYSFTTNNSSWNACGATGPDHVRVFWSQGVTEPGSSGSPLFDTNHRVIGQLHGGASSCANPNFQDCYGRFSTSWFGGGTSNTRLSDWLDPLANGATTLNTLTQIPPGPGNNDCASATIVGAGTFAFSTISATTDGPTETTCALGGYTNVGADIWYRYAAQCTGNATISVCDATFNTKIAIYTSACPGGPNTAIACNDDSCGTRSSVTFPVVTGTLYRVRLGGFFATTGTGNMIISCTPSAPPCPPDVALPHNGFVNVDDLLAVINSWGACPGPCPPACAADINPAGGNCFVNVDDLLAVINAWGPCP